MPLSQVLNSCSLSSPFCLSNPVSFTSKVRIAKSSAPPFQNGFSSLGQNSTGKEVSLRGTRGTKPASSLPQLLARPLPGDPWLPPSAPVVQPLEPAQAFLAELLSQPNKLFKSSSQRVDDCVWVASA